jgi:MFS family permease
MASAICSLATIPLFAALSDRIGRRPVYIGGAIFVMVFSCPAFALIDSGRPALIILSVAIGMAIGHAAMYGPQAAFFSELFGTGVRYSGISFGFQLASPFAGGLAPLIATALLTWSGNSPWPVAVYLSVAAALTAFSVWCAPETYKTNLSSASLESETATQRSESLEEGVRQFASTGRSTSRSVESYVASTSNIRSECENH